MKVSLGKTHKEEMTGQDGVHTLFFNRGPDGVLFSKPELVAPSLWRYTRLPLAFQTPGIIQLRVFARLISRN